MSNKTAILKGLIEKMVSNEVKKQLPILLEELLTEPTPTSTPPVKKLTEVKSTNIGLKRLLNQTIEPEIIPPYSSKQSKKYSSNPMINSILNDTINDLSMRESGRIPSVSLDGQLGMSSMIDESITTEARPVVNPQFVPTADSVLDLKGQNEAVDNLMKWDFKSILDKSKKIKK